MRFARTAAVVFSVAAGALGALAISRHADAARITTQDGPPEAAARAFLASLPADLRRSASFPFDSADRTTWYFIPRERVGVSLLKLDDPQSELLGPLLATALSPEGLLEARGVMKHENILRRVETEAGVDAARRDPGLYYTSVFGKPGGAAPWGWRFEGHHLSISVTQLPGEPPVVGPIFIGANPARVLTGPQTGFRLLAAEEDLGRELITMLSQAGRKTATLSETAYPEIVTGNDPKVRPLQIEGLAAADMSATEQQQLRRLIDLYIGRLTAASAREAWARLEHAGFAKVHFAWAGGIEPEQKHYYRVHGPTLLIEYDNTQNDANHIHTVYRDLERDFGGDALRPHLAAAHSSNP
jgi:Protein of unknown function (DUF3500)